MVRKVIRIKPKKLNPIVAALKAENRSRLVYGEIPRRLSRSGHVWTWHKLAWEETLASAEKKYKKAGYLTLIGSINGQKQLYIRRKSREDYNYNHNW